jgi:hypothetical protein
MKKTLLFCLAFVALSFVCVQFLTWADESAPSNEACVTIDKRDLPVPTSLNAVYALTGEVTLTWDIDVTKPFVGFIVRYGINGGPKNNLAAEVPYVEGQTNYTHPWSVTAPDGELTEYCFEVRTYN